MSRTLPPGYWSLKTCQLQPAIQGFQSEVVGAAERLYLGRDCCEIVTALGIGSKEGLRDGSCRIAMDASGKVVSFIHRKISVVNGLGLPTGSERKLGLSNAVAK